jgi:hypothetical protein
MKKENKLIMHMKQIKEIRIVDKTDEDVSITFIFDDGTEESGVMKADTLKKWLEEQEREKR